MLTKILLLWTLVSARCFSHEDGDVIEKFVPTSEWAEVKEGSHFFEFHFTFLSDIGTNLYSCRSLDLDSSSFSIYFSMKA